MVKKQRISDALILEDFDIVELFDYYPKQEIGVSVSSIYIQISKFRNNPSRIVELNILINALSNIENKKYVSSRYVIMKVEDVIKCFGKNLKKLPKATFVQSTMLMGQYID